MSAYIEGICEIGEEQDLLAALKDLGYAEVEIHSKPVGLMGYRGDAREETAHIVIRKQFVGGASNDVGFRRNEDNTYTAIISQYDTGHLRRKHGVEDFVTTVKAYASANRLQRQAQRRGIRLRREQNGHLIRLVRA